MYMTKTMVAAMAMTKTMALIDLTPSSSVILILIIEMRALASDTQKYSALWLIRPCFGGRRVIVVQ